MAEPDKEIENLALLFKWMREGIPGEFPSIKELCDAYCHKHGVNTPYKLSFKLLDYTEFTNYDFIITPGSPVEFTINDRYILETILQKRNTIYFKHRIYQGLDRLHKMHRTLRHLIPSNVAIALRKESKSWERTIAPLFREKLIKSNLLEIKFTVNVKEIASGTSIQLSGSDPLEIKKEAISRLSDMIFNDEDLMDMLEDIQAIRNHKKESHPSVIAVGGIDGEIREKDEY